MQSTSVTWKFSHRLWPRLSRIAMGCALALLVGSLAGQAQMPSGYPNKPIRLLVPYGAGGVGDTTMRLLANALT
jgi:tripartite-type tricarboxylate transporter receptor subunit TctC